MVRKSSSSAPKQTSLRHVWLASLGAVAVTRREAFGAAARAVDGIDRLQRRASDVAGDVRDIGRGGLITLRERARPLVARIGADVEARLQPLLGRFGAAAKPVKRTRKTARVQRRTGARKARA
jgi:hypothetical protein